MITINLLRISTDSQYLEFSVECPTGYDFTKLHIRRYDDILNPLGYDCSNLLPSGINSSVMRIATSAFGGSTLFYVTFGVTWVGQGSSPGDIPEVTGACSDINSVYANMLDLVLKLNVGCVDESEYDLLLRNQMFLYSHTEAMRLERYIEAEMFYDILKNLFTNCGPTARQITNIANPCNCS